MKKYGCMILGCIFAVILTSRVSAAPLQIQICNEAQESMQSIEGQILYTNQALLFTIQERQPEEVVEYQYQVISHGTQLLEEAEQWKSVERREIWMDYPDGRYQLYIREIDEEAEPGIEEAEPGIAEIKPETIMYEVCFDRCAPEMSLQSEINLDEWQREDIVCRIQSEDRGSGVVNISCQMEGHTEWETIHTEEVGADSCNTEWKLTQETPANGLCFYMKAEDAAGNETVTEYRYFLDKTAPVLTAEGIAAGQLLSAAGQLILQVEEELYEYAAVHMDITRLYEGSARPVESTEWPMTGRKTTFSRMFDQDGIYTVQVQAWDRAGNHGTPVELVFRVDVTAPVITLNGPSDQGKYCTEKELQIAIEEEFYQSNQVVIYVERRLPDGTEPYSIGEWSSTGKCSALAHTFGQDGVYQVSVEAVDEAGHRAEAKQLTFRIDRNKPVIGIGGIGDQALVSKAPQLCFYADELFYEDQIVTIAGSLSGFNQERRDLNFPKFAGTGEHSELEYGITEDGIYQIAMCAMDAAGNTAETSLCFTYDATPPKIGYLDTIDRTYQEEFSLPTHFSRYIEDLTKVTYRIYVNQELFQEDEEIHLPGKYVVTAEATDAAGNLAVKTVEFIIPEKAAAQEVDIDEGRIPMSGEISDMEEADGREEALSEGTNQACIDAQAKNQMRAAALSDSQGIEIKKNIILASCLFISVLAAVTAFLLHLRRIDRKKAS